MSTAKLQSATITFKKISFKIKLVENRIVQLFREILLLEFETRRARTFGKESREFVCEDLKYETS